jgi:DNA-binding transcriptional LysR family regulator
MRMDELEGMLTFVRVVEARSFSGAAKVLGTTQPSVSRRIHALEQRLGASLLVRSTRSLSLTEAGQRYYQAAGRAIAAVEEARLAATDATANARGRLRITAPVSFSTSWLAPRLDGFIRLYPAVELKLYFSEQHLDLIATGMDLAIRIGGPVSAEVKGLSLGNVKRHLVASSLWVQRHGMPEHPNDLSQAHALVFTSEVFWEGWQAIVQGEPSLIHIPSYTCANSGDFLRKLALSGNGVALLPEWLIDDDLASGRLVSLLPEALFPPLELWLVWPLQRYQSAAARRFIDWFVAHAKTCAWGEDKPR